MKLRFHHSKTNPLYQEPFKGIEMNIDIQLLSPLAQLPYDGSLQASGADLMAAIEHPIALEPFERYLVPIGIAIAIPLGYEGQIRPRSGLALKHGVTVLNTPGTIDSDYRGEIKVLLINLGKTSFVIEPHMRIAQLVIAPVNHVDWNPVASLESSLRCEAGFGSTGMF
jgi:dUTP pyrophosphatase